MKAIHWVLVVLAAILLIVGTFVGIRLADGTWSLSAPTTTLPPSATLTFTLTSTNTLTPSVTPTLTETPTPTLTSTGFFGGNYVGTTMTNTPIPAVCEPYPYCLTLTQVANTPIPNVCDFVPCP